MQARHRFYVDRNLFGSIEVRKELKSDLICELEKADRKIMFSRFTDLPPELRGEVYSWYIASLPKAVYTPTQPPLARTCKLLRKECLPVSYSQCWFETHLERIGHG